MRPPRLVALCLLPFCVGCAPPKDGTAAGGEDSGAIDSGTPEESTIWYVGTSDGSTPDRTYSEPTEEVLLIRVLDPAASTVTEEDWSVPSEGALAHYLLVQDVDAAAQTFVSTFVTDDGVIFVSGAYDAGPDWAWTSWHSTSIYQSGAYAGTRVESVDQVLDGGVVHADKSVYDVDGRLTWLIVEALTPLPEPEFEAALAAARG